jgi:hypothetical protein
MKFLILIWVAIFFATASLSGEARGEAYNNDNALKGLKETRVYFDVTVGEPKKLLIRLQLIDKTYNQLAEAGISPVFIVGVRGKASNYFTRDAGYILDVDLAEKKQIEDLVKKFKTHEIGIEQCRIAAGFQEIDVNDFLPEMEVVANGYTSMIGYQAKGYGLVPMD